MADEPIITINGHTLTSAQAMAVRVAVTNFHAETADVHALGNDQHGMKMCTAYHLRLCEIIFILVGGMTK
jgi:hypothetical protein